MTRGQEPATDLRQLFDDLVRFETVLWGAVDDRLRTEADTTLGSLNVLLVIESTPSCRVLDVAQALAITVGGASQAVDRLEAAGRCVRRANPADRRSSILELTAEGKALLSSAGPVFDDELDRLLRAPLDRGDLAQVAGALAVLRRSAGPGVDAGGTAAGAASPRAAKGKAGS